MRGGRSTGGCACTLTYRRISPADRVVATRRLTDVDRPTDQPERYAHPVQRASLALDTALVEEGRLREGVVEDDDEDVRGERGEGGLWARGGAGEGRGVRVGRAGEIGRRRGQHRFLVDDDHGGGRDAGLYRAWVGEVRSGGRDDAQSRAGYGREMAPWTRVDGVNRWIGRAGLRSSIVHDQIRTHE